MDSHILDKKYAYLVIKYSDYIADFIYARIVNDDKISKDTEKDIAYILTFSNNALQKYYVEDFSSIYDQINIYNDIYFNSWVFDIWCVLLFQSLGDTLGYKNGEWEFNKGERADPEYANDMIYEYISLGGINDMSITNWKASDDTILYITTMQVLMEPLHSINEFGEKLQLAYIDAIPKIADRHPGETTMRSLNIQKFIAWDKLPYDKDALGNGSAMRSGCIGLFYPGKPNRKRLIALATECSRITHNSAPAILASITTALFTAYSLEKVPVAHWPHKLLKLLQSEKIDRYIKQSRPDDYHQFARDKVIFYGQWDKYIKKRFSGLKPLLDIRIFKHPVLRIKYFSENHSKGHLDNPGGGAIDSIIMAYDALLESNGSLEKLIVYSILHHGDSDTVGSIAMSWFGGVYNIRKNHDVANNLFMELEYINTYQSLITDEKFQYRLINVFNRDLKLHYARKYYNKFVLKI